MGEPWKRVGEQHLHMGKAARVCGDCWHGWRRLCMGRGRPLVYGEGAPACMGNGNPMKAGNMKAGCGLRTCGFLAISGGPLRMGG